MTTLYDTKPKTSSTGKLIGAAAAFVVAGAAVWYFFLRSKPATDDETISGDELVISSSKKSSSSSKKKEKSSSPTASTTSATTNNESATSSSSTAGSNKTASSPDASLDNNQQQGGGGGGSGMLKQASSRSSNASDSDGDGMRNEPSMFVENSSFGGDVLYAEADESNTVSQPGVVDETGRVEFPHLRFGLKLNKDKWEVSETISPLPTTSIVTFVPKDYKSKKPTPSTPGFPGEFPNCYVTVEDISSLGYTLEEHKEKARDINLGEFNCLLEGMFPAQLSKDTTADVGHFRYIQEITQRSPYVDLHAIFYFALVGDLAYTFQIMAKPEIVAKLRPEFAEMVRSMQITTKSASDDFEVSSFLWMPLGAGVGTASDSTVCEPGRRDNSGSLKIPASWSLPSASSKDVQSLVEEFVPLDNQVAVVCSPSSTRPETIIICKNAAPSIPNNYKPYTGESSNKKETTTRIADGDVVVSEYRKHEKKESALHVKVLKHPSEKLWLLTAPCVFHHQIVSDDMLARLLKAVNLHQPCTAGASGIRYQNCNYGFSFNVEKGGRIMESRLGDKIIMYAPCGGQNSSHFNNNNNNSATSAAAGGGGSLTEEQEREQQMQPVVYVRVGDPKTDPKNCKESLKAWQESIEEKQKDPKETIENVKKEKFGSTEYLTFESTDIVEIGEGRKEDRQSKMFVGMSGTRSTMIRWESAAATFEKYAEMRKSMMGSFEIY